jgi:hypothetical protein
MLHRGILLVQQMSKAANASAASALKRAGGKQNKVGAGCLGVAAKKERREMATVDAIPPATSAEAPAAADTDAATGDALEKGSGAFLRAARALKRAEKKSSGARQISAAAAAKKARCLLTNVDPVPPPATPVEAPAAADTDTASGAAREAAADGASPKGSGSFLQNDR